MYAIRSYYEAFADIQKQAEQEEMVILNTPHGFAVAPTRAGEVLSPKEFEQLSKEERQHKEQVINRLQEQLAAFLEQIPRLHKERREKLREVERKFTMSAVGHLIDELKKKYQDLVITSYSIHYTKLYDAYIPAARW